MPRGVTFDEHDELYYMADKVCIPNNITLRHKLIQEYHNAQGHPSAKRTLCAIKRTFFWPRVAQTVKTCVKACSTCARIKTRTTKALGKTDPLPKATRPCDTLSMDFIT